MHTQPPSNNPGVATNPKESARYEAPAVLELGKAEALTLGTAGHSSDACNCSKAKGIRLL